MNNDDSAIGYWKTNLLELQEKAPKPKMVKCCEIRAKTIEKPEFYGPEFHGLIAREEAEKVGWKFGQNLPNLVYFSYFFLPAKAHFWFEPRGDRLELRLFAFSLMGPSSTICSILTVPIMLAIKGLNQYFDKQRQIVPGKNIGIYRFRFIGSLISNFF